MSQNNVMKFLAQKGHQVFLLEIFKISSISTQMSAIPSKRRANSFSVVALFLDVLKYSSLWDKSLLGSFFHAFPAVHMSMW
jgi:hypothetical protein